MFLFLADFYVSPSILAANELLYKVKNCVGVESRSTARFRG